MPGGQDPGMATSLSAAQRSAVARRSRPEERAQRPAQAQGPREPKSLGVSAGRGRPRVLVWKLLAALTLNSSAGSFVCVCVRAPVSTRGPACMSPGQRGGLEAAAKPRPSRSRAERAPERPPAGSAGTEAIHDFGDVIPGVGEGGRGLSGSGPASAPINATSRALCGAASSVENPELRLLCRGSWQWGCLRKTDRGRPVPALRRLPPPAVPVRPRAILTRDAVTVFKSQGRGSTSPRTSCLYISPFIGEYPASSAGIHLAAGAPGSGRLLVPARVRVEPAAWH